MLDQEQATSFLHGSRSNIRAPLILSSKAAVYFNFILAVVNFGAVYFANLIAKYVFIDAFLSMLQVLHIVVIPAFAVNLCTVCISAYARQVFVALNKPTVNNAVRFLIFAKICSLASAVTMTGLPMWAASDGAAYYPAFLQGLGAFLTLQLGCAFFQVVNPSELPRAYSAALGVKDENTFNNAMIMAFAYLTMSLKDHTQMLRIIEGFPKNFRGALIAIHKEISGDSEAEVMRGNMKIMTILLSTGHNDVTALTSLKHIDALHQKTFKMDSDLAFTGSARS